jgi:hypothetical protein
VQSTSARGVFRKTLMGIMDLLVTFTRISPVLYGGTLVSTFFQLIHHRHTNQIRLIDVLVHRQLAAAISGTSPHPSLLSKTAVDRVMENINRRHRMAQMAGRASVEFYVGLALKVRGEKGEGGNVEEDAFVIRVFKNGVGVFVSS